MRIVAIFMFIASILAYWISSDKGNYIYKANKKELYQVDSISILKWAFSNELYIDTDVGAAKKVSIDSIGVKEDDAAEIKLHKIATFLIWKFHKQLGSPSDRLRTLSPWNQYLVLSQDTTQDLYCTHFSAMYAFFARVNGLSIREIECKGKNDLHIFNEVFIPSANKWIYSDLTHGIPFVLKNSGFCSTLELYSELYSEKDEPLMVGSTNLDEKPKSATQELKEKLRFNFDEQCEFHYYHNASLDITPKPLFYQNQPAILVYSNKFIYYKWPMFKALSILLALISILLVFKTKKSST